MRRGFTGCSKEKTEEKVSSTSSAASGPSVFVGDSGKNSSSQSTLTSQSSSSDNSSKTDSSSKNSSSSSKVESSSSSSKVSSTKKPSSSSSGSSQYKDPIPANAPRIICWGDSITQGVGMTKATAYPGVLQSLIGNDYRVLNAGAGGEKSQTIAARQGANDGVPSVDTLVERYKAMAKRQGSDRYIVIIPQWDRRYTADLKAEFGDKALDIREEMCTIDPATFGFFASGSALAEMKEGKIPTMYKYQNNSNDSLHLNEYGYTAMANIIYEHGKKLGYWK